MVLVVVVLVVLVILDEVAVVLLVVVVVVVEVVVPPPTAEPTEDPGLNAVSPGKGVPTLELPLILDPDPFAPLIFWGAEEAGDALLLTSSGIINGGACLTKLVLCLTALPDVLALELFVDSLEEEPLIDPGRELVPPCDSGNATCFGEVGAERVEEEEVMRGFEAGMTAARTLLIVLASASDPVAGLLAL